uniref:Nicotinamide riboside kinase 2 n=2 Tax=Oryzias latipes TaxID=8090 RepID=H2MUR9_ORYLA
MGPLVWGAVTQQPRPYKCPAGRLSINEVVKGGGIPGRREGQASASDSVGFWLGSPLLPFQCDQQSGDSDEIHHRHRRSDQRWEDHPHQQAAEDLPKLLCGASGRLLQVISALDMEAMVSTVKGWQENPVKFARSHGVSLSSDADGEAVHILIVEGFLIYNYKPLIDIYDKCFYISIPYEECKRRRSTRTYTVPDPPGLFDGHVWPMYLKHRKEMESNCDRIEYVDGTTTKEDIYNKVHESVQNSLLNQS